MTDHDLSYIVESVKYADSLSKPRLETYQMLGEKLGRDWRTIAKAVNRLMPTVNLAKLRLRAGASRMAKRIISKGSVSELIDVLSRPNIGVLEPQKSDKGQGGGFFMSVEMDSLGAVRVGAAQAPLQLTSGEAPEGDVVQPDDSYLVLSNQNEEEHPEPPPPAKPESLLERSLRLSRERLAAARENPGTDVAKLERAEGFKVKRKRQKPAEV